MCEQYLYSTITFGSQVRHERLHIKCKTVEEFKDDQWKPKA